MWSPDVAEGCLRDLRRAMNVGPNAPADDPHRQLDSVGSNPLAPTIRTKRPTCVYVDLRFANETDRTLQLRVWLTDDEVRGEVRIDHAWPHAYRVVERHHRFVREPDGTVYRENELWRLSLDAAANVVQAEELVTRNRAEVRYPVDQARCELVT